MPNIYGKWAIEYVRDVLRGLNAKSGMNGASIHISHFKTMGNGLAMGTYHASNDNSRRHFCFPCSMLRIVQFRHIIKIFINSCCTCKIKHFSLFLAL